MRTANDEMGTEMNIKMRLVSNNVGVEILKWSFCKWRLIIRTNCWRRGYVENCKEQTRMVKFLTRVTENI